MCIVPDDFPEELQHLIFEIAARENLETALCLVLVAKHVRTWIDPILYETIILRSSTSASLLLQTLTTKPPTALIKHLAIASDAITIAQAKSLLLTCSHSTTALAVWGTHRNPTIFLPFLKSPHLTSLSLVSQHQSELTIPPAILGGLTHLAVLGGPYTWFHLRQAARAAAAIELCCDQSTTTPTLTSTYAHASEQDHTPEPSNTAALGLFQALTHFAVCAQNWGSCHALLKVAGRLRYFAIVVPPGSDSDVVGRGAKMAGMIRQRVREMGDGRVVVVEWEQSVQEWDREVRSGGKGGLWERVERLVDGGGR